jgi:cysteine desulfurase
MIYFDHNATSPLLPAARQAWIEASATIIGNPSSPHRLGSRAEAAMNRARESLAAILGCDALDLVWTSGATESNNMVLHHFSRALPNDAEVWISAVEHPCVREATRLYFSNRHRVIPVDSGGVADMDWLSHELSACRPGMVAIMAANNETGIVQPWREALAMCRQYEVPFFCDAVQWIGKRPPIGLGECDFVSGCAHKFGGPKGVGFLKCPGQGRIRPLLVGGPQEEGRRAGTENVASIVAMMAALEARQALMVAGGHKSHAACQSTFERSLLERLPGSALVGGNRERLWNTVAAIMPETDCRLRWVVKLDKLGFAVSTGSACSSGKEEPSHVLAAMGYPASQAGRALRFSSSWETTEEEWRQLLEALVEVYRDACG